MGHTANDDDDYVWFVQERQLDGQWLSVDRAEDDEEAAAKLRHVENHLPGTFRLYRSDWIDDPE